MSDHAPIDLAAERAKRDVRRILEKRTAPPRDGVSVGYTKTGQVVLYFENDEWEVTWPLTVEQTRALVNELNRYAHAAEDLRDLRDGFVRLVWCSPTGKHLDSPIFGGVPAQVRGRVSGAVHLTFAPAVEAAQFLGTKEPKYGWPPSCLYSLKTGAPVGALPRRRRWQIVERDLEYLRRANGEDSAQ